MIKINKYILLILLTITSTPLVNAMEAEKEEVHEQNFFEALPIEMLSKILEYVVHQSNIEAANPSELDNALTNLFLINHQVYGLIRSNILRKTILNMLLTKTGRLGKWKGLIDWIDKFSVSAGQEFILKSEEGDINRVKALLFGGVDIDRQSKTCGIKSTKDAFKGHTALIAAASKNRKDIVRFLLDEGANVNKLNEYCESALTVAVANEHHEIIKMLLDAGAAVNIMARIGLIGRITTILIIACQKGSIEIVKMLLDAKAKVNMQDRYEDTALMVATFYGFKNIVQMLLAAGADITLQNEEEQTALMIANERGFTEIAQLLEEASKSNQEKIN